MVVLSLDNYNAFESALKIVKMGYAVFPLVPHSKVPATSNGFKSATKDETIINEWVKTNPKYNIGIACGIISNLTVIDVDVKGKKKGRESLKSLDLPPTLSVKTPTGGWHLYYHYTPYLKCGTDLLDGIDIRNDGGYVVCPPSINSDGVYIFANNLPIADLLPIHIERLTQKKKEMPQYKTVGGLIKTNRNVTLTSIAGAMRRQGMTDEEIYHALLKVNSNRCTPELPEYEIQSIARSVSKYQPSMPQDQHSVSGDDIKSMSEKITNECMRINEKYSAWQNEIWRKLKIENPSLSVKILEAQDEIDNEFVRYKNNKSSESIIEGRIKTYEDYWRQVSETFEK